MKLLILRMRTRIGEFNRTSFFYGINYRFSFNKYNKRGLKIGGGGNYNLPRRMKITELNCEYGEASFEPNSRNLY